MNSKLSKQGQVAKVAVAVASIYKAAEGQSGKAAARLAVSLGELFARESADVITAALSLKALAERGITNKSKGADATTYQRTSQAGQIFAFYSVGNADAWDKFCSLDMGGWNARQEFRREWMKNVRLETRVSVAGAKAAAAVKAAGEPEAKQEAAKIAAESEARAKIEAAAEPKSAEALRNAAIERAIKRLAEGHTTIEAADKAIAEFCRDVMKRRHAVLAEMYKAAPVEKTDKAPEAPVQQPLKAAA